MMSRPRGCDDRQLATTTDAYLSITLAGGLVVLAEHVDPAEESASIARLLAGKLTVISSAAVPDERARPARVLGAMRSD